MVLLNAVRQVGLIVYGSLAKAGASKVSGIWVWQMGKPYYEGHW